MISRTDRCEFELARCRNALTTANSSPGGAASTGPSALDRRSVTARSSVRSHRIVRWQRSVLQRQHCRPEARILLSGGSPRPAWAGYPRWGWQVVASGWCEKHPSVAIEPGRALGTVPWAEPARHAHVQLVFELGWPTDNSRRSAVQNDPAAPFYPPRGVGGSPSGPANTVGDTGCSIFQAASTKAGRETKTGANGRE